MGVNNSKKEHMTIPETELKKIIVDADELAKFKILDKEYATQNSKLYDLKEYYEKLATEFTARKKEVIKENQEITSNIKKCKTEIDEYIKRYPPLYTQYALLLDEKLFPQFGSKTSRRKSRRKSRN